MKGLSASCRVVIMIATTVPLLVLQLIAFRLGPKWSGAIPIVFHRFALKILGVRVQMTGAPLAKTACLIVANHSSWLDIVILGAQGNLSFIAKKEVAGWPVFGLFAKLQRCLFVDREKRSATGAFKEDMRQRLGQGDILVLFPEGTSSDGNQILPFRSALLSAAEDVVTNTSPDNSTAQSIAVQPVSIAYTKVHGLPMGRQFRPYFAWYGDMEMLGHIWEVMKLGPSDIIIHVHETVTVEQIGNRKALTQYCETKIKQGVSAALFGRPTEE